MRIADSLTAKLLRQFIDEAQFKSLKSSEEASHISLYDAAIKSGLVTDAELTEAYAQEIGKPFVKLDGAISPEMLGLLPERYARQYMAVVYNKNPSVQVAMAAPGVNATDSDFITKLLGQNTQISVATEADINSALAGYTQLAEQEMLKPVVHQPGNQTSGSSKTELIGQSFGHILNQAAEAGAQNIHIEPLEHSARVRFRVNGGLQNTHTLPISVATDLTDYIKAQADLDQSSALPQQGKLKHSDQEMTVSTLPTLNGQQVTLKLLRNQGLLPSLANLGFWGEALQRMEMAILQPNGLVVVSGQTGSDTHTTLLRLTADSAKASRSVATIEHIITYRLDNVSQLQISPATGLDIHKALGLIHNQEPHIVMVDEIQTNKSIAQVEELAQNRLVLAGIRAQSTDHSLAKIGRSKGVPTSLRCIIFVQGSRKLCTACRQSYRPDAKLRAEIDKKFQTDKSKAIASLRKLVAKANQQLPDAGPDQQSTALLETLWRVNPLGCPECNYIGFRGQTNICEVDVHNQYGIASNGQAISIELDALVKALCGIFPIETALAI